MAQRASFAWSLMVLFVTIIAMCSILLPTVTRADGKSAKNRSEKTTEKRAATSEKRNAEKAVLLTAAQQKFALDFATQHHPELARLIQQLRDSNPRQFASAVRDLFRSADRLERLRIHDARSNGNRYRISLDLWKLDSRIRLMAARSAMTNDPSRDAKLKELLRQRGQKRVELYTLERDRLQLRLDRLEELIKSTEERSKDEFIEKEFARLKGSTKSKASQTRSRSPKPTTKSSASAKPPQKSRKKSSAATAVDE